MLKTLLAWLGLVRKDVYSQEAKLVQIDSIYSIYRIENFPSQYIKPRNLEIYLPVNYDSTRPYKVIYLQDGQNLFDSKVAYQNEAMELHKILEENSIHDLIVIGIWNTEQRFREYLPNEIYNSLHKRNKKFIKREYNGTPFGDNYIRFITAELIPFIEAKYSVSKIKSDRIIGGISMGGLISFYTGITNSNLFGKVLCMSTHWPLSVIQDRESIVKEYFPIWEKYFNQKDSIKIYFDYGTENIDSWYPSPQNQINDLIIDSQSQNNIQFKCLKFNGQSHAMRDWKSRIGEAIQFLLE